MVQKQVIVSEGGELEQPDDSAFERLMASAAHEPMIGACKTLRCQPPAEFWLHSARGASDPPRVTKLSVIRRFESAFVSPLNLMECSADLNLYDTFGSHSLAKWVLTP
jgi:hypothetical protein